MEIQLIGSKITRVRHMTQAEMDNEGWDEDCNGKPMAIELSTGIVLYPSMDYEGNGGGAFFGHDKRTGDSFVVYTK